MDAQTFFGSAERHFQKSEYIAIRHLSFKMLSAPKCIQPDSCRVFAFLSNGQKANEKLVYDLADYAKSVAFYNNSKDNQKVYALCLFADTEFSGRQAELFNKIIKHNDVTVICAGYSTKDGSVTVCDKAGFLSSAQTKKILKLLQTIVK